MKILAIDLGKVKSVACDYATFGCHWWLGHQCPMRGRSNTGWIVWSWTCD